MERSFLRSCFPNSIFPARLLQLSAVPGGSAPNQAFGTQHPLYPWHPWLASFQKQVHAIEIDDGVVNVERVHAEDARDFAATLLQCEVRQRSDANFFRRRFEHADTQVVNFCRADLFLCSVAELCRDPRRFCHESDRFNETFVQDGDKRAGIDQQTRPLAPD
jgi:hypothetical protein